MEIIVDYSFFEGQYNQNQNIKAGNTNRLEQYFLSSFRFLDYTL